MGQRKVGDSRGHQTKLPEAPYTGHRRACIHTALNRACTRTPLPRFGTSTLLINTFLNIDGSRVKSPVPGLTE